jgi:hypothetical protein
MSTMFPAEQLQDVGPQVIVPEQPGAQFSGLERQWQMPPLGQAQGPLMTTMSSRASARSTATHRIRPAPQADASSVPIHVFRADSVDNAAAIGDVLVMVVVPFG